MEENQDAAAMVGDGEEHRLLLLWTYVYFFFLQGVPGQGLDVKVLY